jgi:aldose 1-epimerase
VREIRLDGYPAIAMRSTQSELEATFVPEVGMIGASLRHRGDDLVDLGAGLGAYAASGAPTGIPLLHPWANRLAGEGYAAAGLRVRLEADTPHLMRDENGLPIHGVLGASPYWKPTRSDDADLSAALDFGAHEELLAAFPFPHRLTLDVTLRGSTVRIRTSLVATGDRPVPVSFGFHPYLRLPDVPRERWRVALPDCRHLRLDARSIPTGEEERAPAQDDALGSRTFDDGYADVPPDGEFVLAGGGRRIVVRFEEGYPCAQVFAPPTADVVCFEPMTAPTNALISGDRLRLVEPGESFTATFSISVEDAPQAAASLA